MSDMNPFQLSRVYAKGWLAGQASGLSSTGIGLDAEIEALNPYQAAEERCRWATGFKDALCRNEQSSRGRKRQTKFQQKAVKPQYSVD
jgi:ribosome modulation factor